MRATSVKPGKQRLAVYERPMHAMKANVSVHLVKELRKAEGRRNVPVRKGDKVKVVRGSMAGKAGKVQRVDRAKGRVFVEKVTRKKADGTEVMVGIRPAQLVVTELDSADKRRFKQRLKKKTGKDSGMKRG